MNDTNTTTGAIIGLLLLLMIAAGLYWWWQNNRAGMFEEERPSATSTTSTKPSTDDQAEAQEVRAVVTNFGRQLQMVSLAASTTTRDDSIERYYGPYVSSDLIARWKTQPSGAIGREVSRSRPDRIEIESVIRIDGDQYAVIGHVVEVASTTTTSTTSGLTDGVSMDIASTYPVTCTVDKQPDGTWRITDIARSAGTSRTPSSRSAQLPL